MTRTENATMHSSPGFFYVLINISAQEIDPAKNNMDGLCEKLHVILILEVMEAKIKEYSFVEERTDKAAGC